MKQFSSKLNTGFIVILVILVLALLGMVGYKNYKSNSTPVNSEALVLNEQVPEVVKETTTSENTYTYKNHGFEIELPKGFVPQEIQGETGPTTSIELPEGWLIVISDAKWWEKYNMDSLDYVKDQKIGNTLFKVYKSRYAAQSHEAPFYSFWFKQGNVAYLFNGRNGQTGDYGALQLETFKFVGQNN